MARLKFTMQPESLQAVKFTAMVIRVVRSLCKADAKADLSDKSAYYLARINWLIVNGIAEWKGATFSGNRQ